MKFLKWFKRQIFRDDEVGDEAKMYLAYANKHADYPIHKQGKSQLKLFKAIEDAEHAPDPKVLKRAIIEYKAYTNIVSAHKQYMKAWDIEEIKEVKNEVRP